LALLTFIGVFPVAFALGWAAYFLLLVLKVCHLMIASRRMLLVNFLPFLCWADTFCIFAGEHDCCTVIAARFDSSCRLGCWLGCVVVLGQVNVFSSMLFGGILWFRSRLTFLRSGSLLIL